MWKHGNHSPWSFEDVEGVCKMGPEEYNYDDCARCVITFQEIADAFESGPVKFVWQPVTGGKTWVRDWELESKSESMQWKHASSPPPRKFRTLPSAGKLMATIFGDSKRLLPPKTTRVSTTPVYCVTQSRRNDEECWCKESGSRFPLHLKNEIPWLLPDHIWNFTLTVPNTCKIILWHIWQATTV